MDDRIRFITHQGKQILLVDISHCKAAEVKKISTLVPTFVTAQPKGSVLLLADFTGAEFDRDAITLLKRHGFRSAASEAISLGGNGKLAEGILRKHQEFLAKGSAYVRDPRRSDGLAGGRAGVIRSTNHEFRFPISDFQFLIFDFRIEFLVFVSVFSSLFPVLSARSLVNRRPQG